MYIVLFSLRYEDLTEPATVRHQLLRSSLQLHQYLREIDDLEAWVVEREPLAASTEYGTDLTGSSYCRHTDYLLSCIVSFHSFARCSKSSQEAPSICSGIGRSSAEYLRTGKYSQKPI